MTVHIVKGKPRTSGKRKRPAPVVSYPPGHFTQGIGKGCWLTGWKPTEWGVNRGSVIGGQKAAEDGTAFGGRITMDLPNTPHKNRKPGKLKAAA